MTTKLAIATVTPLWALCASGWAFWVGVHKLTGTL